MNETRFRALHAQNHALLRFQRLLKIAAERAELVGGFTAQPVIGLVEFVGGDLEGVFKQAVVVLEFVIGGGDRLEQVAPRFGGWVDARREMLSKLAVEEGRHAR